MHFPVRRLSALAAPICLLVAMTAAQVVQTDRVTIELDGATFELEAAVSTVSGWYPEQADWHPSQDVITAGLTTGTPTPGVPVELRVAVRNASGVPADVAITVVDTDPQVDDLFQALQVSVSEAGRTLGTGPASSLRAALLQPVGPDRSDERVLDVQITTPVSGDDRWAGTRTGIQLLIEGTTR